MEIRTTRFGPVDVQSQDLIRFPAGLLGLDGCFDWVFLADVNNDALGWLQSTTHDQIALAVVSPRRFVPRYQARVTRRELVPLAIDPADGVIVLVIVGKNEFGITLNLKAPLIINLKRRVGRQVVTAADEPLQYELCRDSLPRKKIA